jgi:ribulose-phosphate 3-epimerase
MKISASVYSWKSKTVREAARVLDSAQVDYLHVDCNDNPIVFKDIREIRDVSRTPIDLHIITKTPERYFEAIQEHKIEMVSFQQEEIACKLEIPSYITSKLGISLCTGSSFDVFDSLKDKMSFVMFMTTVPGQSGHAFKQSTFHEIRRFKELFPQKAIHVDGGINNEISFILKNMGISVAVTGSYLANAEVLGAALLNMRSNLPGLGYKVSEFMMNWNELPIVQEDEASIENILTTVNSKKLGFAAIVDKNRCLKGIVTDGDIRRALLKRVNSLGSLSAEDMINRNFISLLENTTIMEMMTVVKAHNAPILFFPINDNEQRLVGAVSFNNFIKGEM